MDLQPIIADVLRAILHKHSIKTVAGMDGWRVKELQTLPLFLLDKLLELFNLIEQTGKWPTALSRSLICLIPKGDGSFSYATYFRHQCGIPPVGRHMSPRCHVVARDMDTSESICLSCKTMHNGCILEFGLRSRKALLIGKPLSGPMMF